MLLLKNWLDEYISIEEDIMKICEEVTLTGSHVESIKKLGCNIDNIVVGKIVEIFKHKNSKKLLITKVDIGSDIIQIVTAAQNLQVNDLVPVALVNSTLSDGTKIYEATLGGEISQGMFCSYKELGYDDSVIPKDYKDGVLRIFSNSSIIGKDIKSVLGLNDTLIELEITPNRPDCLSIIGMSREIAATFGKKINPPVIKNIENTTNNTELNIIINSDNCNRYSACIVNNISITESSRNIQNNLANSGIRPINNIVDLTNYVLLEVGQPLHAFDFDKIHGDIIVRNAVDGELVTTIDGIERSLTSEDILICDSIKPIAIAGVMGLKNSEVDCNTKNILIESASFSKETIQKTSKRLGLRTEASIRFEKGTDFNATKFAICRFLSLLNIDNGKSPI